MLTSGKTGQDAGTVGSADGSTGLVRLTEKEFLAQVVELAEVLGFRSYHTFDSRRSAAGFPDLVLVRPPRVIFAELKRQNGRVTIPQHLWFHDLDECPGVEVYIWKPSDWNEIVEVMR